VSHLYKDLSARHGLAGSKTAKVAIPQIFEHGIVAVNISLGSLYLTKYAGLGWQVQAILFLPAKDDVLGKSMEFI
jgi:hypothetical protein